jgi:2,3-bisphosphoglycerate-independent phosphoglycerate mutase
LSPSREANAFVSAQTPHLEALFSKHPWTALDASGVDVGLIPGQMGDSNVGHLNIGAGRVVFQWLGLLNQAITSGEFEQNQVLRDAILKAKERNKALHLVGLLSDGGVHSHIQHLIKILQMADQLGFRQVYLHAFLDGRDVPPQSAIPFLLQIEETFKALNVGQIATVSGRYYGMDRDKRWDRTEKFWQALTENFGRRADSAEQAVLQAYSQKINDEFVEPTLLPGAKSLQDGDSIFFFNFRADRSRQLAYALIDPNFKGFPRKIWPKVDIASMTEIHQDLNVPVAFCPVDMNHTLGEVLSKAGKTQLRLAETEKYAHVTFFFNGGEEKEFPGEDRLLIPSPRVATYDLQPEMSAYGISNALSKAIASDKYDFILVNFANGDMVGHTGVWQAALKAMETLDQVVGKLAQEVENKGGVLLITADHGNIEQMKDEQTGAPHTAHTCNPVPFIMITSQSNPRLKNQGRLSDIAPTVLDIMGIEQPQEMKGLSLIWNGEKGD